MQRRVQSSTWLISRVNRLWNCCIRFTTRVDQYQPIFHFYRRQQSPIGPSVSSKGSHLT
ncbi:unnamed protein product [Toxocara canis]|uniref:Uncharacterized protein n=1 Tax=Toxocara canis TaxID=6265 RepID=A0A183U6D3_TOXCA|nr:unnamed protein product [Toxocara canis]